MPITHHAESPVFEDIVKFTGFKKSRNSDKDFRTKAASLILVMDNSKSNQTTKLRCFSNYLFFTPVICVNKHTIRDCIPHKEILGFFQAPTYPDVLVILFQPPSSSDVHLYGLQLSSIQKAQQLGQILGEPKVQQSERISPLIKAPTPKPKEKLGSLDSIRNHPKDTTFISIGAPFLNSGETVISRLDNGASNRQASMKFGATLKNVNETDRRDNRRSCSVGSAFRDSEVLVTSSDRVRFQLRNPPVVRRANGVYGTQKECTSNSRVLSNNQSVYTENESPFSRRDGINNGPFRPKMDDHVTQNGIKSCKRIVGGSTHTDEIYSRHNLNSNGRKSPFNTYKAHKVSGIISSSCDTPLFDDGCSTPYPTDPNENVELFSIGYYNDEEDNTIDGSITDTPSATPYNSKDDQTEDAWVENLTYIGNHTSNGSSITADGSVYMYVAQQVNPRVC